MIENNENRLTEVEIASLGIEEMPDDFIDQDGADDDEDGECGEDVNNG